MKPLVELKNLSKHYLLKKKKLIAVNDISLQIYPGETFGLVGESGCGKSTIAKMILQLIEPTMGSIFFDQIDLRKLSKNDMKSMRRNMQIVFQDPYASLNPRMTIQDIIGEPLHIHGLAKGKKRKERVEQLLEFVGLNASHMSRFPHEFSGGQRQRIGIARALAVEPKFLVCDEPISALDVSIQAQIVNLLKDLQDKMGLTYLFIAHDLAMVKYLSDRVAVMYMGNLLELAESHNLYSNPLHPYTELLLSSIPIPDPEIERKKSRIILPSDLPNPLSPPMGCVFHPRCPKAQKICTEKTPPFVAFRPGHFAACHFPN